MLEQLNEKQQRLYVAGEAARRGYGGISAVSRESGISRVTITAGMKELCAAQNRETSVLPDNRIRRVGGGRKKLAVTQPDLIEKTVKTANPKGDPMSPLRWTTLSMDHIADALKALGARISPMSVYRILKAKGFAMRANKKDIEGKQHPDRNAQFEHIEQSGLKMQLQELPILSVDGKKSELVGEFKNNGKEWQPTGSDTRVNVHDFGDKDENGNRIKAIPYGVYNVLKKQGFVNVGINHNTAAFAVESIRRYWTEQGEKAYGKSTPEHPKAILILADAGSSNGYKNNLWKYSLQQFANESHLTIQLCHYPPGTSKWNAIEHELFSFISINWRGKPLVSYEFIIELLNHTRTKEGLTVTAMQDTNTYTTGLTFTKQQMAQLNITRDEFHGDWNYTIRPQPLL
jgi:Rhodopirellula transposase DDE domain